MAVKACVIIVIYIRYQTHMTDKQTSLQKAKNKYHTQKTKQVLLRFLVDQDADIISWLNSLKKGEKMKYARKAFRAEMTRQENGKG